MASTGALLVLTLALAVSSHENGAHDHSVGEHHHHDHEHIHLHDGHHHHHHAHGGQAPPAHTRVHTHAEPEAPEEWTTSQAWTHALAGVVAVTLGGNAAILLVMRWSVIPHSMLRVMLGFAVGGLLGDAFLHIIPHVHGHEEHTFHEEHSHDLSFGMSILAGIVSFFVIERLLQALTGDVGGEHSHGGGGADSDKKHDDDDGQHDDHHSSTTPSRRAAALAPRRSARLRKRAVSVSGADALAAAAPPAAAPAARARAAGDVKRGALDWLRGIKSAALLNIAADTVHNFTDGLALGAAFVHSKQLGVSTTLAVLLHEVPHEVGDFAILLSQGFSRRSAFLVQFVSAVGALAGCVAGLVLSGPGAGAGAGAEAESPKWVLGVTCGGFIYIACVSVLPQLVQGEARLWQTIAETAAIGLGIGLMVLVTWFE